MKYKKNYILILFFCLQVLNVFSKEIIIDRKFTSTEIYNALSDSNPPPHKDVQIDVVLRNNFSHDQQLYLSIINPVIDKIMITDSAKVTMLGDYKRFTERTYKHINFVYPLLLHGKETRLVHIKVFKQWQALNFRVKLSNENAFIKTTNHDNFFIGIFYGILFMYLLLLICFYIFSKSNFFIIYLSINFFMLLLFFQYSGTGNQFIWFYSATVQKYISRFAVLGYLTAHLSFTRTFFAVRFKNNFSGVIIKILVSILILFFLLFLVQIYNSSYGYLYPDSFYFLISSLFLIYGFTVIGLSIYTYVESGRRETMWVLIGMLFHILNWILFINNEFGMVKSLNYLDNFKLFDSNIFVPQLNYFITMLEIFIVTIFIAINYHNLIRQNNLSTRRLEFLQKRNINTFVLGQEEEREKISREIGLTISRDISHLKKSLSSFYQKTQEHKVLPAVLNDIEKTLQDVLDITSNYVAPDMQEMKLVELITTATDKLFSEIKIVYDFNKIPEQLQLSPVANINLYRILQEISNNILKHANAENVTISAVKDNKALQIKISDDGIGFSGNTKDSSGIGLMNIESRMNSLNGNFYVLSNEKRGSSIHLIMSLKDIT
ncbi:MAG: sensory box histidine kinase [Bacteroidota bacterium]|nr:sensory box histidine kinase [Bacteroidota bacterium]